MVMTFHGLRARGFTLIEVMLVIMIMGIMAGLVVMNVDSIEQRKAMQAHELLRYDLKKIARESQDQGRILGLTVLPATDVVSSAYRVLEYQVQPQPMLQGDTIHSLNQPQRATWLAAPDFKTQTLPDDVSMQIELTELNPNAQDKLNQADSTQLASPQVVRPQVVWLGTGEALAARIQLMRQNKPLGEPIEIGSNGQIVSDSDSTDHAR